MKKKIVFILVIMWIGFIFYNSTKTATVSNEKSYSILDVMKKGYHKFENITDIHLMQKPMNKGELNLILRKNAHAFEYMVLSLIVLSIFNFKGLKLREHIIYSLFICLLIAVFDEFYQNFIPGRGSSVRDILIDFAGSIVGVVIFMLIKKLKNK